jgi:hypothetical protein
MELADLIGLAAEFTSRSPLNRVEELGIASIYDAPWWGWRMPWTPCLASCRNLWWWGSITYRPGIGCRKPKR